MVTTLVALSACSGMKTKTYVHDEAAMGGWKTYSWTSEPIVAKENIAANLVTFDAWLRSTVDKKMAAKGYQLSAAGTPGDISVDYRFGSESHMNNKESNSPRDYMDRAFDTSVGLNESETAFYNHPTSDTVRVEGIIFSVLNTASKRMVWEGVAKQTVSDESSSLDHVEKNVSAAIDTLFGEFPDAVK
ncbi:uncharacterized protein DUF4136 [Sinobacterium caligoides]|uniref:Uncharacterized protein DUF4136 n=2 Tax=Sinobacterium caligoides TaxID=933926 RepID=A0A3N2DP74_9GAMM|nr:uncharacterized protein DUF4136 [Sinobacterium caligoides]